MCRRSGRLAPRRTVGIARAVRMGAGARTAAFVRLGKRSSPASAPTSWLLSTRGSTVFDVGETVDRVLAAGAKLANGGAGSPLADRSRPLCRADPVVSQPDAVSRSRSLAAGARPGARSVGRSAGAPGAARGAGARCTRRVAPALTCSRSPVPGGCGGRGGCSRRARRRRRLV